MGWVLWYNVGVMAGSGNSTWAAIKLSGLIFAASVLFIVFLALYVNAVVEDRRVVPEAKTEVNVRADGIAGRVYPRSPQ